MIQAKKIIDMCVYIYVRGKSRGEVQVNDAIILKGHMSMWLAGQAMENLCDSSW